MDIEEIKAFLATDEGKSLVENNEATTGLRAKKDELLSKNVQMANQLKAYAELGDADALAQIVADHKAKVDKGEDKNTDVVDTKTVAELEHLRKELDKERGIRTNREQAMVNSFVDAEIVSAIAKFKGVPELLKHVVVGRVKGELKDDGKIGFTVMNADGSPMFKNGKEAGLDDLMAEIKSNTVYGRAFDADDVQGSGTRPNAGKTSKDKSHLSLTEIMAAQKKRG